MVKRRREILPDSEDDVSLSPRPYEKCWYAIIEAPQWRYS